MLDHSESRYTHLQTHLPGSRPSGGNQQAFPFLKAAFYVFVAGIAAQVWINIELGAFHVTLAMPGTRSSPSFLATGGEDKRIFPDQPGDVDDQLPTYWVRAAYRASLVCGGCISPTVEKYLAKSYEISPLNWGLAKWRIKFAFDHWAQVNPALRHRAIAELNASWSASANHSKLLALTDQISDPRGAIYYRLIISGLQSSYGHH